MQIRNQATLYWTHRYILIRGVLVYICDWTRQRLAVKQTSTQKMLTGFKLVLTSHRLIE